ncbi:uncharacterized protein LOC107737991 [Sinocyclocheilus rhinocerous]|uniref:uncharacterized protein LOC107737991 n=1 Tax=Sinocyclocheilus rhinocerous TaxID=307959 RepID=UPI0007B88587|nr:PREDICTED: uncharacterized protein LOC107737991 [Sinocyclocheilus rhinocerous]
MEAGRLCIERAVAHFIIMSNTSAPSLNSSVSGWRRPLWYQYEVCAEAPHWFIFYFGVKVLNLVAGFPMNALVLWQILRKKSEGSTSDIFIFNLSILDAYFGVMNVNEVYSGVILSAFFIMVFCNLSIIWVRKSAAGKEVMNPVKKKAFKMVIIVLAIIVGSYLPPVALMPFASTFSFMKLHCKVLLGVFSIMDLSCTVEPSLYISKMDRSTFCQCLQSPSKKPNSVSV